MATTSDGALRSALRGAGRSLGCIGAFVAGGLLWAAIAQPTTARSPVPPPDRSAAYTRAVAMPAEPEVWLVDGFNVLHAAVLRGRDRGRWWGDEARARLLERVAALEAPGVELCVVFDGPEPPAADAARAGAAQVVFAPSADEWLVRRVKQARGSARVVVVTADRKLADRSRHHGARVVSPAAFLAEGVAS